MFITTTGSMPLLMYFYLRGHEHTVTPGVSSVGYNHFNNVSHLILKKKLSAASHKQQCIVGNRLWPLYILSVSRILFVPSKTSIRFPIINIAEILRQPIY